MPVSTMSAAQYKTFLAAVPDCDLMSARVPAPIALEPARDVTTGRFARTDSRRGVQTVRLPGGVVAYRLGSGGHIYARREAAEREAAWAK